MARTIEQQVESLSKRLFVKDPELRSFLLTVLREKVYQTPPSHLSEERWLRRLYLTCMYYFTGATYDDVARRTTSKAAKNKYQTPTKEALHLLVKETVAILLDRYIAAGHIPLLFAKKREKLIHQNYAIARYLATVTHLEPHQMAKTIKKKFALVGPDLSNAKKVLKEYGIDVPLSTVAGERKKDIEQILLTSHDRVLVQQTLNGLSYNYVANLRRFSANDPHRTIISVQELACQIGITKLKNTAIGRLVRLLKQEGIPLSNARYYHKRYKKWSHAYITSQSMAIEARTILRTKLTNKSELSSQGLYRIAGAANRYPPTQRIFNKQYLHFFDAVELVGIPFNKKKNRQKTVKDLCSDSPVSIFFFGNTYKYHPDDHEELITHLKARKNLA